ncbi:MAG: amidohydrolase family protein [Ornithinimicrobium sp.]
MSRPARTLLHRARIYAGAAPGATPDAGPSEAMLTEADRVVWIGPQQRTRQVLRELDPSAGDQVVDADGALVTPAFCDAHVHLTMTGQGLDGIDLSTTASISEALRFIESAARHTRGRPIYAHSWDETRWVERRALTATELDRASYGGVVYAPRIDAHSASVSSAMAAVARVHGLDGWDGSGLVTRDAFATVTGAFTAGMTPADREHYLDLALRAAAEQGIALVHETGAAHLTSFDDIHHVLEAGTRAGRPHTVAYWGELVHDSERAAELHRHLGVIGLAGDLCADGSFGSRTAHLREPYLDDTGAPSGDYGYGYLDAAAIRDHVVACTRAGLQAGTHVIGDAALGAVTEGLRAAAEIVGREAIRAAGHRLEHVELADAASLDVLSDLGVWVSAQPAFDAVWGGVDGMYAARLGRERALSVLPLRSMVRAGARLAFGSDSPVTPFDPWGGVRAAVTHHCADERLSVTEAFAAHTRAGYAMGGVDGGLLRPGGAATYVIWDGPPGLDSETSMSSEPSGLPRFEHAHAPLPIARRTVIDGLTAFDRTHDGGMP